MLQLKNIVKSYTVGELTQVALKGISLNFRENEFVSILGQSGSGKTTMLNIIGGLDRYDSGDLVINGVSTKKYRDADWDAYRNTSIGFVFQSYNLIPHQNVLSNVEMALTLSGVSRKERRKRAVEVLKKVGLQDHIHKKPNQLSGGQMQRVAIARALINNPDILLADEPTGALDTETSIQIMNLLKQISEEKLVIMVTHNPELAEVYSTRIVNLKDGQITSDTNPFDVPEGSVEEKLTKNQKRVSMSFWTSLGLSFANLRTKIGRTILTSFAGSIGIIGIALILALSTGMNQYITRVQKETMTSYPITISSQTIDATSIMQLRGQMLGLSSQKETKEYDDKVHTDYQSLKQSDAVTNNLIQNNLAEFKKYLDDPTSEIHQYVGENGIIYSYNISFGVYAKNPNQQLINTNIELDGGNGNSNRPRMFNFVNMGVNNESAKNFSEMVAGTNGQPISSVVTDSYDMVAGYWPTGYNEVVMVLNENNSIPVQSMYQLGFITKEQYTSAKNQLANKQDGEDFTLSYEDMLQKIFYLVPSSENYVKNENGSYSQIKNPEYDTDGLMNKSIPLKVTGIIRPKEDAKNATINTVVAYTNLLTNYVIDRANESAIVQAQKNTPEINVVHFNATTDEEKIQDTKEYLLNLSEDEKANMYQLILYYDGKNQNQEINEDTNSFDMNALSKLSMNPQSGISGMLENYLNDSPNTTTLLAIYNDYIGGKSLEKNLASFGAVSYESPSSISIYADSFENKDAIGKEIEKYNNTVGEDSKISYTDYVALMTSSLTTIINGISYVLIAFVAVSLFVSSIMIGIITYISVMERTKEIGILRALGASKKNISQLFNAETFIIGIFSGIIGIGITLLLLIPINNVIQTVSKIEDLSAVLPLESAGILILISIIITVIGGLIPSRSAAKKDPVEALRTE